MPLMVSNLRQFTILLSSNYLHNILTHVNLKLVKLYFCSSLTIRHKRAKPYT